MLTEFFPFSFNQICPRVCPCECGCIHEDLLFPIPPVVDSADGIVDAWLWISRA
jgi:hypothetical protein